MTAEPFLFCRSQSFSINKWIQVWNCCLTEWIVYVCVCVYDENEIYELSSNDNNNTDMILVHKYTSNENYEIRFVLL